MQITVLGERIRQRRIALNMTQTELGEAIGVAGATVTRYESGNIKNLKYETIVKLAETLKTTPADLMGWTQKEEPANKDELQKKANDLFISLPAEKQEQALDFLNFLHGHSSDKK